jgi:hypothetical protein
MVLALPSDWTKFPTLLSWIVEVSFILIYAALCLDLLTVFSPIFHRIFARILFIDATLLPGSAPWLVSELSRWRNRLCRFAVQAVLIYALVSFHIIGEWFTRLMVIHLRWLPQSAFAVVACVGYVVFLWDLVAVFLPPMSQYKEALERAVWTHGQ